MVEDAFTRGHAALAAGDRVQAKRWLDRAHRLAPDNGTITLLLASSIIGADNPKSATLFTEVLASADVRDGWLGLAAARFLMGDLIAARTALGALLSRHALRADVEALVGQVVHATGAPGWCGLTSDGVLLIRAVGLAKAEVRVDGRPVPDTSANRPTSRPDRATHGTDDTKELALPPTWPLARRASVTVDDRHLIGSPIALGVIGRVEGQVESARDGIRGWAWCPGDPDADPGLSVRVGRVRLGIAAIAATTGIPGLAPFARPRSFAIKWRELPAGEAPVHVRGRDDRDLAGSPVARGRIVADARPRAEQVDQRIVPDRSTSKSADRPVVPVPDRRRIPGDRANAVILVTHNDGGGVERRVQASVARHAGRGHRAIVLRPLKQPNGAAGVVVETAGWPNSRFELPHEQSALLRLLRGARPAEIELHHFLNHDPSMFEVIRALGVPYTAHMHDYAWFCPRIALVGRGHRYCGEPEPAACDACVTMNGSFLHEDICVAALLKRSRDFLFGASQVIAPSRDAATRMERHFPGLATVVIPHEDDAAVDEPPPSPIVAGTVRICVAGAIGLHKGFHVLLACARDARKRDLDLTFVVAGTTIDDQRLIDTGRVFVTGPYQPDEAITLIRAQAAHLALLPSIWPETWCLGLTELWRAGLRVAAFDIGAPAERIRRTGRGFLLPVGLSPRRINDALLNAARGRSLLPI